MGWASRGATRSRKVRERVRASRAVATPLPWVAPPLSGPRERRGMGGAGPSVRLREAARGRGGDAAAEGAWVPSAQWRQKREEWSLRSTASRSSFALSPTASVYLVGPPDDHRCARSLQLESHATGRNLMSDRSRVGAACPDGVAAKRTWVPCAAFRYSQPAAWGTRPGVRGCAP